jgi:predicted Zn-dependent peptidase
MNTQHVQLKIPLSFKQVVNIVKQLWAEQNIDDTEIPEEHKQIVRERIKKYKDNPDS